MTVFLTDPDLCTEPAVFRVTFHNLEAGAVSVREVCAACERELAPLPGFVASTRIGAAA